MTVTRVSILGCGLLSLLMTSASFAQFELDTKWVPEHANSLVLINSDRILASEMAQKESWDAANTTAFERGASIIPPNFGKVMFASQFDLDNLEPIWTVGILADSKANTSVAKAAEHSGREMEKLGERDAVALTGDQYAVQLDESTVGLMAPANRQALVRWLKDGDAGRVRVSEYFSKAIGFADKNADVIVAFDLEHLMSASEARTRLLQLESVKAKDIETVAKAIERLEGLTLGITIRDVATGVLRIDFQDGTEGLDKITKELILEILSERGSMIDDLLAWEVSVETSRVVFRGPLSPTGLRKINLLINHPIRDHFSGSDSETPTSPGSVGKNSREYFDSIDVYFRELVELLNDPRHRSARGYTKWFDKYADKIDRLPPRNIDPQLLEFGASIAKTFRSVSQTLFDSVATVTSDIAQQRSNRNTWHYSYYGDSYYGYRSNNMMRKTIQAQEYSKAAEQAKRIMEEARNQLGDMRRDMSLKYSDF